MMQIFVRTPAGPTIAVEAASVPQLRAVIADRTGVPAEEQSLVCNGKLLHTGSSLQDLVTVHCHLPLLGGAKKRKKKQLVGPKKQKHVKKKVKLQALLYYKVDENNKITRLRRECTKDCRAATFMAIHPDRYSCGRCGFALRFKEE